MARKRRPHQFATLRERVLERRRAGLCIGCGSHDLATPRRCRDCADREAERLRKRKRRSREQGLCRSCNARAVPGRSMCAKHLKANRQSANEAYRARLERGLCVMCGEPCDREGRRTARCSSCSLRLKLRAAGVDQHEAYE